MTDRAKRYGAKFPPPFPMRPSRGPIAKRTRGVLALVMVGAIAVLVVIAVIAAMSHATPHVVTVPAADRNASPALRVAAEALDYRPSTLAGTGKLESKPASDALSPLSSGLLPVGSRPPAFTLRTPTGVALSSGSLRGKAVLLEFFAAWCPHCAAEAPHLNALYAKEPHDKVAFVSVNADSENAPSVFAYHVWFELGFPALVDAGSHPVAWPSHGPLGAVASSYHVAYYPTFYVLDRSGRIVWRSDGEQPDALIAHEIAVSLR